jgi:hypothetical protein
LADQRSGLSCRLRLGDAEHLVASVKLGGGRRVYRIVPIENFSFILSSQDVRIVFLFSSAVGELLALNRDDLAAAQPQPSYENRCPCPSVLTVLVVLPFQSYSCDVQSQPSSTGVHLNRLRSEPIVF